MKAAQPSLTARGVALARSRLARPQTAEGDPDAELRLYAGLLPPRWRAAEGPGQPRSGSERRGHRMMFVADRTAFIDGETLRGLRSGITQVVIVGAGYDGRALRFRSPGVRFFELDHPATQSDKRDRMEALRVPLDHLTFVEIDLMSDRVDTALARAGQRDDQPSLFICEGLVRYLSRVAVERMLTGLWARAGRGSRLLLTAGESPGGRRRHGFFVAAIGEPVRSGFSAGEAARVLSRAGWAVDRVVRRSEPGGRERLLIAAVPTT